MTPVCVCMSLGGVECHFMHVATFSTTDNTKVKSLLWQYREGRRTTRDY